MGTSQSWFWEMTVGLGWGSSSHMIVVHKAGALSHSQDFLNSHPPIMSLTYLRTSTQSSISPHVAPYKWNLELRRLQDAISQVVIRYRRWDISSGSSISHLQWSIRKRKFAADNQYKGSTQQLYIVYLFFACSFYAVALFVHFWPMSSTTSKTTTLGFLFWLLVCRKFALDIQTRPTRSTNAPGWFQAMYPAQGCFKHQTFSEQIKWLPSKCPCQILPLLCQVQRIWYSEP